MPGLYFDQFEVGKVYNHPTHRSVTQFDSTWHTAMTLNTQPLHLSLDFAAKEGIYGKPQFNSMYALGIIMGQSVTDLTRGTFIEYVGMTDVQFPRPVFDGDTLYTRSTILSRTPDPSPETGVVELLHEGFNQNGEMVATCKRTIRVRRKAG
jgi:acyl dehydratase